MTWRRGLPQFPGGNARRLRPALCTGAQCGERRRVIERGGTRLMTTRTHDVPVRSEGRPLVGRPSELLQRVVLRRECCGHLASAHFIEAVVESSDVALPACTWRTIGYRPARRYACCTVTPIVSAALSGTIVVSPFVTPGSTS